MSEPENRNLAPVRDSWSARRETWNLVGSPLRPSSVDIGYLARAIEECREGFKLPRLLLLGVTPEVYQLALAQDYEITAVDYSLGMVRAVWPGPRRRAVCADWRQMPLKDGSRDIATCDGGYVLLNASQKAEFARSLHRVLTPGARLLLRIFVKRLQPDRPEDVLDDLRAGRIGSIHVLKLRCMAWDANEEGNTACVIWKTLHEGISDFPSLARKLGWTEDDLVTLDVMKESTIRYHCPTREDVLACLTRSPGGFRLLRTEEPPYESGEQTPTYVFERE